MSSIGVPRNYNESVIRQNVFLERKPMTNWILTKIETIISIVVAKFEVLGEIVFSKNLGILHS